MKLFKCNHCLELIKEPDTGVCPICNHADYSEVTRKFFEYERRGPAFDNVCRSGEAHPDFGGPQ